MSSTYFVTGISTDIGKTVVAAILTEALQADYWKPIQAGELDNTDTHKVTRWVTNEKSNFHESSFDLETPMSPHAAAAIDGVEISVKVKARNFDIFGIIFNGDEHPTTEDIISRMTQVPILGRLDDEPYIDARVISEYAERFADKLNASVK